MDQPQATTFNVAPTQWGIFSPQRICSLSHDFHLHPAMQLPELERLAIDLAATGQCRFMAPGTLPGSPFCHQPAHPEGREISEVFHRIEEPGSWIALYNIETNPTYRSFIREVLDCMRPLVEAEQGPIHRETGFIFISAPPSVTPFHIDRENNFWLQIRGRKTINVWDHNDHEVVPLSLVEGFILSGANATFQESYIERSHEFDVGAGEGVYFPSTSPHMTRSDTTWVRPGDGVSISIGVTFYTQRTRRLAYVHAANMVLRRVGLKPNQLGESAGLDILIRYPLGLAVVWAKKTFRGYQPTNSF